MPAEGAGIPLLDLHQLMTVHVEAELAHKHEGLFGGDELQIGIAPQQLLDGGPVIRLHMVDDQAVQRPLAQQVLQILQQLAAGRPIHRVEEHALLIQQEVGVVGDAPGDGMDIFEQSRPVVVGAHPIQIFRHFAYAVHVRSSFCVHARMN